MSNLSDSMLMSLIQEGATVILPRDSEITTLEDSFRSRLINKRRRRPHISVIPSPVPG